jgi:hypothetical protein
MSNEAITEPATCPEKNKKNDTFPTGKSTPEPKNPYTPSKQRKSSIMRLVTINLKLRKSH